MRLNAGRPQADGVILGTDSSHAGSNAKENLSDVVIALRTHHELFYSIDEKSRYSTLGQRRPSVSQPHYQFYWRNQAAIVRVLCGKVQIIVDKKAYYIDSGTWVYIPENLRYYLKSSVEAKPDLQFVTAAVNEVKSA
ncbi:MAG TPA: hypothetical protein VK502_02870 [Candidatus Saccharimonadales bacterium]|nr:hypothetical protein [Candidatus Saccharimonadales bacterium]